MAVQRWILSHSVPDRRAVSAFGLPTRQPRDRRMVRRQQREARRQLERFHRQLLDEGVVNDRVGQTWVQRWRHTDYYVVLGEGRPYSGNPEKPEPTYMLLDLQTGAIDRVKQSALDDDEDIQIWQRIA